MLNLLFGEWFSARDMVPFLQTAAAARGRGMLGHKDRVPSHRGLPTVVLRFGRREPFDDELPAMLQNHRQRFFGKVRSVFHPQPKPAAKFALSQGGEEIVEITHGKTGSAAVRNYSPPPLFGRGAGGEGGVVYQVPKLFSGSKANLQRFSYAKPFQNRF